MEKKSDRVIGSIAIDVVIAMVFLVIAYYFKNYISAVITIIWFVFSIIENSRKNDMEKASHKLTYAVKILWFILMWVITFETAFKLITLIKK